MTLINDILDISKIESGTVVVDLGELRLADLQSYVERTFNHVAESKGLDFSIDMATDVQKSVYTDAKRLQQVIKNLLSNAFKFTQEGHVSFTVKPAAFGWNTENENLNRAGSVLEFSVSDTGIGIPPDKQQIIFEAFQQADGSTSRKFGGTGLGLAISREIARLLGGEIRLVSSPGKGSTFTLFLPQTFVPQKTQRRPAASPGENGASRQVSAQPESDPVVLETPKLVNEVGDDRNCLEPGDPILLIVENDLSFARLLLEAARERGFKGLVTSLGAAALAMTSEFKPDAITLDICLPDIDGWRVIDRLKNDMTTRHIPVCILSTETAHDRGARYGALAVLDKPIKSREKLDELLDTIREFISQPVKELVVIGSAPPGREQLADYIGGEQFRLTEAATGAGRARTARRANGRLRGAAVATPRHAD